MNTRTASSVSILFFLFLSLQGMGQSVPKPLQNEGLDRYCLTSEMNQRLREEAPPRKAEGIREAEQKLQDRYNNYEGGERGQVYVVPVVFHVIHANGPENIPAENIEDAMDILTRDFRKNNADTSDIVSPFNNIASDVEIEFRLAQKDPMGNCHRGITRTYSQKTYDGDAQMKTLIQWDPSMYLNVWICNSINIGGNAAGYTIQPATADQYPSQDGIVLQYDYLGSLSPSSPGKSRTLTHEVGHYLGLDHPWGGQNAGQPGSTSNPDNCNYDDGIGDTPNTVGWTYCDLNGSSCGSDDNVQNYMSYSYCSRMFTQDQSSAMRSAITSSVADRNNLWTSSNLQATGVSGGDILCEADLSADRRVICAGGSVQFTDLSYHGPTSWNWQFPGANTTSSTNQDPQISYPDTGTYDVTLTAQNSNGSATKTVQDFIKVIPNTGDPLPWVDYLENISDLQQYYKYFVHDIVNPSVKWEHTDQVGEGVSNGCLMLENHANSADDIDAFSTTTMDASQVPNGNLEISFDVAYAKISSGDQGELVVYASNNCGDSWATRGTFSTSDLETASPQASPFFPNEDQWVRKTINTSLVGAYNVQDLRFKFEFTSGGGNNLFIDNINVHDQEDVGIEDRSEQKPDWTLHPNPAQERAFIQLELPRQEAVSIGILDLRGKKVRDIEAGGSLQPGSHRIELDLSGMEAGPYFVRLRTGDRRSTQKIFKR